MREREGLEYHIKKLEPYLMANGKSYPTPPQVRVTCVYYGLGQREKLGKVCLDLLTTQFLLTCPRVGSKGNRTFVEHENTFLCY